MDALDGRERTRSAASADALCDADGRTPPDTLSETG
jgi:hypothetical protein